MSIKQLISKLLDNGELSASEREELAAFDPDKLFCELEELKMKAEESERSKLGEKERLELDIKTLMLERDKLKASHEELLRRQAVRELAGKYRFSDADYLDYLLKKESINTADEQACAEFIEKMQLEKPDSFELTLKSGSGIVPAGKAGSGENCGTADFIGSIISKLENVSHGM